MARKEKEVVYSSEEGRTENGERVVYVEKKSNNKKKWLLGCGIPLLLLLGIIIAFAACTNSVVNEVDKEMNKNQGTQDKVSKEVHKLGESVTVEKVKVTVTKAEFVSENDELSSPPEQGKALKVYYKVENKNDDQILFADTDFIVTVDGKTQKMWAGSADTESGFSDQVNKGGHAEGYEYYDVPDADKYTVEMNFTPMLDTYKTKWVIKKSEIKEVQQ